MPDDRAVFGAAIVDGLTGAFAVIGTAREYATWLGRRPPSCA
jgi:hypothetical protein